MKHIIITALNIAAKCHMYMACYMFAELTTIHRFTLYTLSGARECPLVLSSTVTHILIMANHWHMNISHVKYPYILIEELIDIQIICHNMADGIVVVHLPELIKFRAVFSKLCSFVLSLWNGVPFCLLNPPVLYLTIRIMFISSQEKLLHYFVRNVSHYLGSYAKHNSV